MFDPRIIEDLGRRLAESVPESARLFRDDLERTFRAILTSAFQRMDLVTREELEVQEAVLARTREKIEAMEKRLKELEALISARWPQAGENKIKEEP
jgi:BMFP domain-containing protein YqiC